MKPRHFLLIILCSLTVPLYADKNKVIVDPMVAFRYPSSYSEQIITYFTQILYKLEMRRHNPAMQQELCLDSHIQTLTHVDSMLRDRHDIKQDDVEFLQNMIDRIDSLIAQLESEDTTKTVMMQELCNSIKNSLST